MYSFQPSEMHDGFGLREQGRSEESARGPPRASHGSVKGRREDFRRKSLDSSPSNFSSTVSPVVCERLGSFTCVASGLDEG